MTTSDCNVLIRHCKFCLIIIVQRNIQCTCVFNTCLYIVNRFHLVRSGNFNLQFITIVYLCQVCRITIFVCHADCSLLWLLNCDCIFILHKSSFYLQILSWHLKGHKFISLRYLYLIVILTIDFHSVVN